MAGVIAWFLRGPVLSTDVEVSFFPDYYNQGNKYWNLGKYDLALAEYEKALNVRPGDHPGVPRLLEMLANEYVKNGDLRRAETLLQRAAARYPGQFGFQEKLHRVRVLKQDPSRMSK